MDLLSEVSTHFHILLVIWFRLGAAVMTVPIMSSPHIPVRLKGLLAFFVSLAILPWAGDNFPPLPENTMMIAMVLVKEILIGIMLGFMMSVMFATFQLGAQFFATQIGLGMSQVLDPITQEETPLLGYLFYSMAVLIFLVSGGMHMIIKALTDSYELMPIVDNLNRGHMIELGLKYFTLMFEVALKIAFPILAISTIIVFTLGLVGKAAPQANILILGLPIQWAVGMIMVVAVIPVMVNMFIHFFDVALLDFMDRVSAMGKGTV